MRKQEVIKIMDGDHEHTFRITQMAATRLERWINRVFLLVAKCGKNALDIPLGDLSLESDQFKSRLFAALKQHGVEGILKMIGTLDYDDVEPLWNELLTCCERVNGNSYQQCTQENLDTFITDFRNIYKLKIEALKVNFGFFPNVGNSPTETSDLEQEPAIVISKVTPT